MTLSRYILIFSAILISTLIHGQEFTEVNVPMTSKAKYFDTTPQLRDMPIILPGERDRSWKDDIIGNKSVEDEYKNMEADIPEDFVDPVLQLSYPASREITGPVINMDGVGNVNGVYPPYTDGDVGPDHYFQMINLSFQIFDKQGNSLFGPADNPVQQQIDR